MSGQDLIDQILPAISYGAGIAVLLGVSEWLVIFVVRAFLDHFGTRRL